MQIFIKILYSHFNYNKMKQDEYEQFIQFWQISFEKHSCNNHYKTIITTITIILYNIITLLVI